jgi:hypothetical protein
MLVGLGRLGNLDEVADLCAGRPVLAVRTADRIRAGLTAHHPVAGAELIRGLAGRGDLAGGLFAVALLADSRTRWPESRRELLLGLREHPEPEVRDWALAVEMKWG